MLPQRIRFCARRHRAGGVAASARSYRRCAQGRRRDCRARSDRRRKLSAATQAAGRAIAAHACVAGCRRTAVDAADPRTAGGRGRPQGYCGADADRRRRVAASAKSIRGKPLPAMDRGPANRADHGRALSARPAQHRAAVVAAKHRRRRYSDRRLRHRFAFDRQRAAISESAHPGDRHKPHEPRLRPQEKPRTRA